MWIVHYGHFKNEKSKLTNFAVFRQENVHLIPKPGHTYSDCYTSSMSNIWIEDTLNFHHGLRIYRY